MAGKGHPPTLEELRERRELEPDRTVLELSGLILDLEDALGCEVNVVEFDAPSPVAVRIQGQAVPL